MTNDTRKWIEIKEPKGSIMSPLTDLSNKSSDQVTIDNTGKKWKELGNYNTNEFLDINQAIKSSEEQEKVFDQKYLISELSKKDRILEIDQEITKEKERQKKVLQIPLDQSPIGPGNDLVRRNEIS
jgi:hypothetical protein